MKFSHEELIQLLMNIVLSKSPAAFDQKKLDWWYDIKMRILKPFLRWQTYLMKLVV